MVQTKSLLFVLLDVSKFVHASSLCQWPANAKPNLRLLVDPVELGLLPVLDLLLLEPEGDLLLGVLDAVATVAHVAADVL